MRKSPTELAFVLTPVALVARVRGCWSAAAGAAVRHWGRQPKYPTPHLASGGMVLSGLRA